MRKRGRTKAGAAGAARGSAPVVILLLVLFLASVARADDTAKVVSNTQLDPYGYTGLIEQADIQGSGVVVGSPHLVVTAAHVIFDPVRRAWREFSWKPRNEGSGRTVRILRYIGSYADLVETHGETDARTFAQDFALGMSYEPLLDDRRYAPVDGSAASSLRSTASKQIIGFPSGLYDDGHSNEDRMHSTGTFSRRFAQKSTEYHTVEGVSLGPGGSGGGVWVRSSDVWRWAGVYVSGLTKSLGDSVNLAGVVAHAGSMQQLLTEVIAAATPGPPRIVSAPAFFEVKYDERFDLEVQVEPGLLETTVRWYFRTGDGEGRTLGSYRSVYSTIVSRSIRASTPNMSYRVELSNSAGTVSSPWIEARITDLVAPRILSQPSGLELGIGESGVLEVEYEGYPSPYVTWESLRESGDASNIGYSSSFCYAPNGNRLEIDADCLPADGALVRLRVRSKAGEAVSEWIPISVARPPLLASYGPLPTELTWNETVEVSAVSEEATGIRWQWKAPDDGWRSVPWTMVTGSASERRLVLANDASQSPPLHGYAFRAVAERRYLPLDANSAFVEEVPLPSFQIAADSPPVLAGEVRAGEWHLEYRSLRPPSVEWQAWDARAEVWRPFSAAETAVFDDLGRAVLRPFDIIRSLELRALVRHPLWDAPQIHAFPSKDEAAVVDDAIARCPMPFAGFHSGISASGNRVALRDSGPGGERRLWTFELSGTTLRQIGRPLPVERGLNSGMRPWALQGDLLVIVNRTAYAGGDGLAGGSLEIYGWDAAVADWALRQTIRVPAEDPGEVVVEYVSVTGDWMHVTAGLSHLYRRGPDDQWEWVQTLERPASVPKSLWMEEFRYFHFLDDALFVGSRTALGEHAYALFHYRWNPGAGRFDFVEHRLTDELYFTSSEGRLVGNGVEGSFRHLVTATWTEADGFETGERVNHFAAPYGFGAALPYGALGRDRAGPGSEIWFFRLVDGGRIEIYDELVLQRLGGPFTQLQPFAGVSEFGYFAVAGDAAGQNWLFAVPWKSVWDPAPPSFAPWLATVPNPATGRPGVEFRAPVEGGPMPRLLASDNLREWAEVTDEAVVVDPDADGDGWTRRLRLEPPADSPSRFFRLEENAHPEP